MKRDANGSGRSQGGGSEAKQSGCRGGSSGGSSGSRPGPRPARGGGGDPRHYPRKARLCPGGEQGEGRSRLRKRPGLVPAAPGSVSDGDPTSSRDLSYLEEKRQLAQLAPGMDPAPRPGITGEPRRAPAPPGTQPGTQLSPGTTRNLTRNPSSPGMTGNPTRNSTEPWHHLGTTPGPGTTATTTGTAGATTVRTPALRQGARGLPGALRGSGVWGTVTIPHRRLLGAAHSSAGPRPTQTEAARGNRGTRIPPPHSDRAGMTLGLRPQLRGGDAG